MAEYIEREALLKRIDGIWDCADMVFEPNDHCCRADDCASCKWRETKNAIRKIAANIPAADVRPVPDGGIGEMSDGYHTFNGLYYQRMVLFAALVKAHKDKAWKSWRHEDGELCFGGGWFIVGIDTPEGSYTYHYEEKDWNRFDCEELPVAKHWDGHSEEDVTRLLSLDVRPVVRGKWKDAMQNCNDSPHVKCSVCGEYYWRYFKKFNFCPNCGADMREES